jgi:hypothetical protein
MKIILLLAASLLAAETIELPIEQPPESIEKPLPLPEPKTLDFTYLSIGAAAVVTADPRSIYTATPDLFFGTRHFIRPRHAIDYGIGADIHLFLQLAYVQASYLYYLTPSRHPYIGIGLTLGAFHIPAAGWLLPSFGPWANIPLTLGYQFSTSNNHHRFIQFQVTPLRTATISYGFGF